MSSQHLENFSVRLYLSMIIVVAITSMLQAQRNLHLTKDELNNYKKNLEVYGTDSKIPAFSNVIEANYNNLLKDNGIFFEKKDNKWGLFDSNKSKLILPYEIDSVLVVRALPKTYYHILKNGNWEVISFEKNYKIKNVPPLYEISTSFFDSKRYLDEKLIVIFNGKEGVIDLSYNLLVPIMHDHVKEVVSVRRSDSDPKLFSVYLNDKMGLLINNHFLPAVYDELTSLAYVNSETKLTYLNELFYLAPKLNSKRGVLNASGQEILPFVYDDLIFCVPSKPLVEPVYVVKKDGFYSVITKSETLIPSIYEEIVYLNWKNEENSMFIVKKDNNYGVIDDKNNVLIPLQYEFIKPNYDVFSKYRNTYIVKKNNLYGVIGLLGNIKVPIEHKSYEAFE